MYISYYILVSLYIEFNIYIGIIKKKIDNIDFMIGLATMTLPQLKAKINLQSRLLKCCEQHEEMFLLISYDLDLLEVEIEALKAGLTFLERMQFLSCKSL